MKSVKEGLRNNNVGRNKNICRSKRSLKHQNILLYACLLCNCYFLASNQGNLESKWLFCPVLYFYILWFATYNSSSRRQYHVPDPSAAAVLFPVVLEISTMKSRKNTAYLL